MVDEIFGVVTTAVVNTAVQAGLSAASQGILGGGTVDVYGVLFGESEEFARSGYQYDNTPPPGWGHNSVVPFHPADANRVEFQGRPSLPISYYEWYDVSVWNRANFFFDSARR